jgi:hypothetical protein
MAVPARAIAERRIAEHFLEQDAVRHDSAIEYETARPVRARAFERLKDCRVIRQGQGNRWYLDAPAWIARRGERRKRVLVLAVAGVAIGAVLSIF